MKTAIAIAIVTDWAVLKNGPDTQVAAVEMNTLIGMAMKKMPARMHQMLQLGVGVGVGVGVGHVGIVNPLGEDCGQVGLTVGPFALTVTAYEPPPLRSSGPVEPALVLVHGPSEVPSVVLAATVVFVNGVPPGVVTVQSNEVARGGVTLVVSATTGVPGIHPVTTALGVPTVGQDGQEGVMIVDSIIGPHAGSPGTDIVTCTVSCVMKPGG